jgi:membrane associated rhomboid family serine protease
MYKNRGAHVGGAIMGWLLGIALLSSELDNKRHAVNTDIYIFICICPC